MFVGTVGGFERPLLEKAGVRFESLDEVQAGPIHGVNPLKALVSAGKMAWGTLQALRLLGARKPDIVLSTGGWVGLPVSLAAWLRRIPVVIFLPDIEPGLSIKALRPLARKIAVTTPLSAPYIPAMKMVVTGYPLRRRLLSATRAEALAHFKLDPDKRTLLVFGGSRGARSLNIAVTDALDALLSKDDLQIIHVTGDLDAERAAPHQGRTGYQAFAYLHDDMGLAFAAADLCLARSGASALGELPHFALPSILVPYPHAWRYQKVNADYLADRGAALVLPDETLKADLAATVRGLLDDPARLAAMREAARLLAPGDGAANIVTLLGGLIHKKGTPQP